jgi:hypothetical protein
MASSVSKKANPKTAGKARDSALQVSRQRSMSSVRSRAKIQATISDSGTPLDADPDDVAVTQVVTIGLRAFHEWSLHDRSATLSGDGA